MTPLIEVPSFPDFLESFDPCIRRFDANLRIAFALNGQSKVATTRGKKRSKL